MINIAVIGKVSVGKSSFINSFVQTPVSAVALQRETIVPIRYVFDPNVPRVEVQRRSKMEPLPMDLSVVETRKVYGITSASITDYPGLDDANDPRDILGALIEKLAEYDLVLFLVDAASPFVSKSESELFGRLRDAIDENYARGVCVKLLTVVTKYVDWDQDVVDIVRENTQGLPCVFRWNAFNSIMCLPGEFKGFSDWKKICSMGRAETYDFDNLRGFLKNYSVVDAKKNCAIAYHASCNSWERFAAAVSFGAEHTSVFEKLCTWILRQKSCPLERAEIRDALIRAKNFMYISVWLAERVLAHICTRGWCNGEFMKFLEAAQIYPKPSKLEFKYINLGVLTKHVRIPLARDILIAYLEEVLSCLNFKRIRDYYESIVAANSTALNLRIHSFLERNRLHVINSVHSDLTVKFPGVFPVTSYENLTEQIKNRLLPWTESELKTLLKFSGCEYTPVPNEDRLKLLKRLVVPSSYVEIANLFHQYYECSTRDLCKMFPEHWHAMDLSRDPLMANILPLVGICGWEFIHGLEHPSSKIFDSGVSAKILAGLNGEHKFVPNHLFLQWCYTHLNTPITLKELWVWVQ